MSLLVAILTRRVTSGLFYGFPPTKKRKADPSAAGRARARPAGRDDKWGPRKTR
jgi:hypothetical protein